MKIKPLVILFFTLIQVGYTQSEKRIEGTIMCNDVALKNVDVINLNTKQVTVTNEFGRFKLVAQFGNKLMFISKDYEYKTIILTPNDMANENLKFELIKKPEELEEVIILNNIKAPVIHNVQALLDKQYSPDQQSHVKNPLINDGSIVNGADFNKISTLILKLFIKEKSKKTISKTDFKTTVKDVLDSDFYINALKLKTDQVALFIDFCDADPKSKVVLENEQILSLMDFLFEKNSEFKKL